MTFDFYSNIEGELKNWGDAFYTYFRVDDLSTVSVISDGLPAIVEKYRPGQDMKLGLQPMQAIHLTSDTVDEMKKNGCEKVTW